MSPTPQSERDARRAFLDTRRRINAVRMNTLFAHGYDEQWGHINPTHAEFITRFSKMLTSGDEILDAACGTGKYWHLLLQSGLRVVGVDHSDAMLSNARAKYPSVPTLRAALQDLNAIPEFTRRFRGLLCVDALENVGPEDWPGALAALRGTLQPGAPAYLTVELPDLSDEPDPPDDPDAPLVNGEVLNGGSYHYYPSDASVDESLEAAGFHLSDAAIGDGYRHLLCTTQ